jgi:hypothetical protein
MIEKSWCEVEAKARRKKREKVKYRVKERVLWLWRGKTIKKDAKPVTQSERMMKMIEEKRAFCYENWYSR